MNKIFTEINKPILIIGKGCSGKSFLAGQISHGFHHSVELDGANIMKRKQFMFQYVEKHTDIIIIDDLPLCHLYEFYPTRHGQIRIEKRSIKGYYMDAPQFIITVDADKKSITNSMKRRFKIIETHIDKNEDGVNQFDAHQL